MRQKRYREVIGATTTHYKLYKAKKNWLIAGIALFSFGIGAASVTQATPVAAATAITVGTAPAASSAASSAATDSVSPASEAASNVTSSATVTSSSAVSSAAPAGSVASSTVTDSATTSSTAASSAATAGSSAVSTAAPVSSDTATTSTAASSAATKASPATTITATSSAATVQYRTPPVKGGVEESATIVPSTPDKSEVTTSGTNFQLNFVAAAGDTITVKIDGADISDNLYPNSVTNYLEIKNVTKATETDADGHSNVVTATVNATNNDTGTLTEKIEADGSYVQYFDLNLLDNYIYYSVTADKTTTTTVNKEMTVYINGVVAAHTTFQVSYTEAPMRVLAANYYQEMDIYNANPIIFQLPNFGVSTSAATASILSLKDLADLDAKTAEYRVAMPTDFVLDTAATAELNQGRAFTITQDANTKEVVLTYNDLSAADTTGDDVAPAYIQGSFLGYQANTINSASTPNTVTITTNTDAQPIVTQSSGYNTFKYEAGDKARGGYWYSWPKDYISDSGGLSDDLDIYTDLQRSASKDDTMRIAAGASNYAGSAVNQVTTLVQVPAGFTATSMYVKLPEHLMTFNQTDSLPYTITYKDGSTNGGVLSSPQTDVPLDSTKVLATISFQYNVPDSPNLTNGASSAESVTGKSAYNHLEPYFTLPTVSIYLNQNTDVPTGSYDVPSTMSFINANGESTVLRDTSQKITVLDGQTDAYVTVHATAQTQVATSAGEVLTSDNVSPLSAPEVRAVSGLALSNGTTSKATDAVAQFLNKPIFYFIAPAQTHFKVNLNELKSELPGAVITAYETQDGKAAYKIDLTQADSVAASSSFGASGDTDYLDDEPIAVTGVFRNGTTSDWNSDSSGILERLINFFEIQANADAKEGSDDLQIYYTSQNQVNDLSAGQDTNGALTGDPNAIKVVITNPTYTIKNIKGINGSAMVHGAADNSFTNTGTTTVYQPLANNQYAINVTNVADTDLTNVSTLINLPTIGDTFGSEFTVNLAGPVTEVPADVTVLYATTAQAQSDTTNAQPDITNYVSADQISDWSTIRSIYVHTAKVVANGELTRLVFNIEDPTQLQDVGKTAYFDSGLYADHLIPILTTKDSAPSLTVTGTATVKFAFLLPDGTQIAAPTLAEQVQIGKTKITKPTITSEIVPEGYSLVDANNAPLTITTGTTAYTVGATIDSGADYKDLNGVNGDLAAIGQVAQYGVDGDTILIPVTLVNPQTVKVVYIDDTTKTDLGQPDTITGPALTAVPTTFNTATRIAEYEKAGYVLVSDATKDITLTYDDDATVDQTYEVHFVHGTTVVTPDTPTTPTETGTNTSAYDLNRTVTQTIQYVYSAGGKVAADQHQSVTFQRAAVVDQVTGEVLGYLAPSDVAAYQTDASKVTLTNNSWTVTAGSADFKAIVSPDKAGYLNDLATTTAYTVTPKTGDSKLTVTYALPQRAIVNYVDDDANGAQVHQDVLTGAPAETNAYANVQNAVEHGLVALGYVVVGNDLPAKSIITFDDQDGDQVYTVHLKHQTQPATANLQKVVTEIVHYVYANGTAAAPTVTDQVSFTRQGTVDQVTGQATYTAWTAKNGDTTFDAKVSPTITGYTPDQTEIAAITGLTAASANVQVTVTYNKDTNGGTTTPDNPGTDGGTTTPDNPGTDGGTTTPDNPGTDGGGTTTPDNPDTDGGTTTPDNPGTDAGTTTPDNPGTDGGTTTPDNPGTDGGTTTPDNPGTGTTTPDNPGTDGGTTTPDNPGTDGGTTTPDNPGTDGGTTTPDNPGTDGGTTTPDNPGTDGGTTTPDNPGTDVVTTPTVAQPATPSVTAATGRDTPTVKATSAPAPEATLTPQATAKAATLPQTNDANEAWLATAGLTILGSVGLLGATTLRKRKDDNLN